MFDPRTERFLGLVMAQNLSSVSADPYVHIPFLFHPPLLVFSSWFLWPDTTANNLAEVGFGFLSPSRIVEEWTVSFVIVTTTFALVRVNRPGFSPSSPLVRLPSRDGIWFNSDVLPQYFTIASSPLRVLYNQEIHSAFVGLIDQYSRSRSILLYTRQLGKRWLSLLNWNDVS